MTKNEFLETVSKLVVEENNKRGNTLFSSVVIAQAICESGWGQSQIMMKANAIFGIKATSNWKGKVYNAQTKECYDCVSYTNINACFRAYNSLQESISDYFDLITKAERYRKACVANSPLECITAIKNGGYATSPTYINTIMSIINSNNLTKYDNVENVQNSVDNSSRYIVGKNYTLQVDLNVRYGAGTNNAIKKYNELTVDGKKHAYIQTNAVLKKGTVVTCLEIIKNGQDIWLKIPSGYVAGYYQGNEYIK
jgi:hypothetical protein